MSADIVLTCRMWGETYQGHSPQGALKIGDTAEDDDLREAMCHFMDSTASGIPAHDEVMRGTGIEEMSYTRYDGDKRVEVAIAVEYRMTWRLAMGLLAMYDAYHPSGCSRKELELWLERHLEVRNRPHIGWEAW